MGILLTISAPGPAEIAGIWDQLRSNTATIDIVGEEMFISIDLSEEPATAEGDDSPLAEVDLEVIDDQAIDGAEAVEPEPDAEVEPDPEPDAAPPAASEEPAADTLGGKVLAILRADPENTFTTTDLYDEIGSANTTYGSVNATLAQLVRAGSVERPSRGQYQAVA